MKPPLQGPGPGGLPTLWWLFQVPAQQARPQPGVPRGTWAPSDPAAKGSPCARRTGTPSPSAPRGPHAGLCPGPCVCPELRARQVAAGGGGVREGAGSTPLPAERPLCSRSAGGVTARPRSLGSRLRPACGQPSGARASCPSVPLSVCLSASSTPVSPAARPGEHRQAGAGVSVTQARAGSGRQPCRGHHGRRSVRLLCVCPASRPQASGT